jgi:hypothetical protein
LFAALPWCPNEDVELVWGSGPPSRERTGILGLHDDPFGTVSMVFTPDEGLLAYDRERPCERQEGKLRVEGVRLHLDVGLEFAVLRATAVTSPVSRAFRDSASVRQSFVELAQATSAHALFFDQEERTWTCLHPMKSEFHCLYKDSYASSDFRYLRTDHYAYEVLVIIGQ